MDIVFVSTWDIECGIATYTCDLAAELAKNHRVTVLCQKGKKAPATIPGVSVVPIFTYQHPIAVIEVFKALQSSKRAPDIVHFQHEFGIFKNTRELVKQASEYTAAPVMMTLHTPSVRGWHFDWNPSLVHAPLLHSPEIGRWYVPHGVRPRQNNILRSNALRDKHDIPDGWLLYLVPGFVGVNKGQVEIIEAFLAADPARAALAIVGRCADGAFSGQLEAIVDATDRKVVYDEGFKTREELDTWFDAADAVVLGGPKVTSESASGQLATAIGAGRAVLARDVEIYRDHGGAARLWRNGAELRRLFELGPRMLFNELAYCAQVQSHRRSWAHVASEHVDKYEYVRSQR